jgi:hypothetical protein
MDESGKGIVMLYTDHPATEFWKYFIEEPANHDRAEVYPRNDGSENLALKIALVRYLISQGQRETAARQIVESAAPEEGISRRLAEVRRDSTNPLAESLARGLVRVFEERPRLVEVKPELRRVRDDVQAMAAVYDSITAYSIRDWSRDPFGAAAHAWRPRAKSWEVRANLSAFGLIGREPIKNLHVCGEAYSDYQGYIEGSLRSAIDALATLGVESSLAEG